MVSIKLLSVRRGSRVRQTLFGGRPVTVACRVTDDVQISHMRCILRLSMKEDTVKEIVRKYVIEKEGWKVEPTRGAGPDLLYEGRIVETKGSKSYFNKAIKQIVEYGPKYHEISVAFPIDTLTCEKLAKLDALGHVLSLKHNRNLKILLLDEPEPSSYALAIFYGASLTYNAIQRIRELQIWTYPDTPAEEKDYEAKRIGDINTLIRACLRRMIVDSSNLWTTKM